MINPCGQLIVLTVRIMQLTISGSSGSTLKWWTSSFKHSLLFSLAAVWNTVFPSLVYEECAGADTTVTNSYMQHLQTSVYNHACVSVCMCEFEFEWLDAYRTLGIQWHIKFIHQHLDNIRMVSTNCQAQCIHAILWNHGGRHVHVFTYIYRAYNYADYSIVTVVDYSLQHSL